MQRPHRFILWLALLLSLATNLASLFLLTLSSWFLASCAIAGVLGTSATFNYLLPSAGVRLLSLTRTAGRYFERITGHDATLRILTELRVHIFKSILPLSPGQTAQFSDGEILNRLISDVETLDHFYLRILAPLCTTGIVILCAVLTLAKADLLLALALLIISLAAWLLIPPVCYLLGRRIGVAIDQRRGEYRALLVEWLRGQTGLLVFGAEKSFRRRLEWLEGSWYKSQVEHARLNGLVQGGMVILSGLAVVLILYLAVVAPNFPAAERGWIVAAVFLTLALFEAIVPGIIAFQPLGQLVAAAGRIHKLLYQTTALHYPTAGVEVPEHPSIRVEGVNFSYPGRLQPALQSIYFFLEAGEKIALLGHTGCGKSSLLYLLTRSFMPQSGAVLLGGNPLDHYSEADLRRTMAVAPQRVHIFSATLRENLLIACSAADDGKLRDILCKVGLEELLRNNGLDDWLGEGGRSLSGGERRRLGVARVLLRQAPILLLDEPTEGLDRDNEQKILDLLLDQPSSSSLLLITHHTAGLERMDRIVVMEEGKIVKQGTPRQILAKRRSCTGSLGVFD